MLNMFILLKWKDLIRFIEFFFPTVLLIILSNKKKLNPFLNKMSQTQKVRVFKLRNQKEEELQKGLGQLREELLSLRTAKIAGGTASKLGRIGVLDYD